MGLRSHLRANRSGVIRMLGLALVCLSAVCVSSASNVQAAVWHVDGTSSGNGTSWAQAFATIQEGVNAASGGDEIWVKEGTYLVSSEIVMGKAVGIYGGFDGTEIWRNQRDWKTHVTTVDGQNSRRCFRIAASVNNDVFINIDAVVHTPVSGSETTITKYSADWKEITGVEFTGRLQPPVILRHGDSEFNYLSSSTGEVYKQEAAGPRLGIFYWLQVE